MKTYLFKSILIAEVLFIMILSGCQNKVDDYVYEMIDLSHSYSGETLYWVTATPFQLDTVFKGFTDKGYFYCANDFRTAEHGGTHIDAPIHFN